MIVLKRSHFVYKRRFSFSKTDFRVQNWRFVSKHLHLRFQTCTSSFKLASRISIQRLLFLRFRSSYFSDACRFHCLLCELHSGFGYFIGFHGLECLRAGDFRQPGRGTGYHFHRRISKSPDYDFIALFGGWIWKVLGIETLFVLSAVLGLCNSAYAATIKEGAPKGAAS